MDELTKISDVAKILGVSPSTLRHWEREGLISFMRSKHNNYREFTFESLVALCDIILYRNFELPLNSIKNVKYQTEKELGETLFNLKTNIDEQINKLNKIKDNLIKKEQLLQDLTEFKKQKIEIKSIKLETIYHFSFKDKEAVQNYLSDPSCAITIFSATNNESKYGILLKKSRKNILREEDSNKKRYLYGLFWSNELEENNKNDFFKFAKSHKLILGNFICQYILSSYDKERGYCHFFKGWVEIF
ncbi:MerR family transcriptional regulator [Bacillus cereus]|uniref:MerR family transcriptional regulator n=1 Tax=Bacillus cereus TaxID=1396 RepID=UPI001E2D2938|nr:MerR family transcriptional regulator [Bacillus cereus]MCD2338317.1 MerR family transcriptional regulator [Bacillus cereus]